MNTIDHIRSNETIEQTFNPDKASHDLAARAITSPLDSDTQQVAPHVLTTIDETGVIPPVSTDIELPRRAYTSQSEEFDTGELSPLLDLDSLTVLERMRLEMIAEQADEKFGEDLVGEALETYGQLKAAIDLPGYDDHYVVTSFAHDDSPESEENPSGKGDTNPKPPTTSFATDYMSRLYVKDGNVEKMLTYPVPYKHGNGIIIARENGSNNLQGVKELLEDPTVTKQHLYVLTDAVRVNHRGTAESVQARVEANLTMPLEAFTDEKARAQAVRKATR